jgi:H/ACA ribonucleoprotein complex subunit 4
MKSLPAEREKKELLIKKEAETDPEKGFEPEKRPIATYLDYGIVNIDKPAGPTSHQVSDFVKKILKVKKAGHSGTLDPQVTGVLPIALGSATRIVEYLLKAGKEYVCIMHMHKEVSEKKLHEIFEKFKGRIMQMPPVKSAVKRQLRERNIYYLEILEREEKDVLFKVGCQAGTYIRKLVHNIGEQLKVGAHMAELRRTKAATFGESTLVTLQDLKDAVHYHQEEEKETFLRHCVQPMEAAIQHLPKVYVFDSAIESICHGASLKMPGLVKLDRDIQKNNITAMLSLKGELIGLGLAQTTSKDMLKEKGIAIKTNKVFMQPGTYKGC